MKYKILGIIPARGGSKGIPKKNIISIAGKSLLAWTIEEAKKSRFLNKIVVSSDDPQIISVAEKYNCEIIKRPKRYATDYASSASVIIHALKYLKKEENYTPDIIVLLQPTSPLRTFVDIDKAIKIFIRKRAEALISITEWDNKCLKCFFMKKGILQGIVNNEFPFMSRQILPKIYIPNGAIYIVLEKKFRKHKKLFLKKTIGFLMDKEKSIDLDSPQDIPFLENILKKYK